MNYSPLERLLEFNLPEEIKSQCINRKFYLYFPDKKDVIYVQEFDKNLLMEERIKDLLSEYFEIEDCTYHAIQNHPDYVKSKTGIVAFSYENVVVTKNSCVFKKSNTHDMGLTLDEIKKFMMNIFINVHYEDACVEIIK